MRRDKPMDVAVLTQALAKASRVKACMPGDKKCKKKKKSWRPVFPILHPSRMGTPRTYSPGSANGAIGMPDGGSDGGGGAAPAGEGIKPSKAKVLHEMKRSMGLVEFFSNHSWGSQPNPAWGGYSVPSFGMVAMRGGGPTIGGPGFHHDSEFKGGRYNLRKSPGLGFRTETAWKIWDKALEVIEKYKTLPKHAVLMRAMASAGIHRGQLDPSELRLLEMGIEWYLTDPGSLAAKRAPGGLGPGGGPVDGGGTLGGSGAP